MSIYDCFCCPKFCTPHPAQTVVTSMNDSAMPPDQGEQPSVPLANAPQVSNNAFFPNSQSLRMERHMMKNDFHVNNVLEISSSPNCPTSSSTGSAIRSDRTSMKDSGVPAVQVTRPSVPLANAPPVSSNASFPSRESLNLRIQKHVSNNFDFNDKSKIISPPSSHISDFNGNPIGITNNMVWYLKTAMDGVIPNETLAMMGDPLRNTNSLEVQMICNKDQKIVAVHKRAEEIMGFTAQELLGSPIMSYVDNGSNFKRLDGNFSFSQGHERVYPTVLHRNIKVKNLNSLIKNFFLSNIFHNQLEKDVFCITSIVSEYLSNYFPAHVFINRYKTYTWIRIVIMMPQISLPSMQLEIVGSRNHQQVPLDNPHLALSAITSDKTSTVKCFIPLQNAPRQAFSDLFSHQAAASNHPSSRLPFRHNRKNDNKSDGELAGRPITPPPLQLEFIE